MARFSPLGVTLRVTAGDPRLMAGVALACRGWEAFADPQGPTLELALTLGPVATGDIRVAADGQLLSIRGGVEAHADAGLGRAEARVADADAFDDPEFREQVLDSLLLWMLTRRDRTPIHASGFVAGTTAILLAGPSGSGKSCLALAAHRAGFALLSDDTVYLETARRLRIWGVPRPVHLFPEDAPGRDEAPIRLRSGKRKRAIAVPMPTAPVTATDAVLCVLTRGDHVSLDPIPASAARAALGPLEPGFDLLSAETDVAMRRIMRHGAWRLTLNAVPDDAIAVLAKNLPRLTRRDPA